MKIFNQRSPGTLLFLSLILFSNILPAQTREQWTPLFDGKTLNGWKQLGGNAKFAVENGEIVGTSVANTLNSFIATEKEFSDFILELDIKIEDTSNNSGVQTRSHYDPNGNNGKGKVYGRQVELDPSSRKWTGGIYDEGRRDWLYPLSLNPGAQDQFKMNAYNHFRIECIGNEMKTWVNGKVAAYVVDTVDSGGFIALQVHATSAGHAGKKVHFKNIRIVTENLQPAAFEKGIYVVNLQPNALSDYEKNDGWKLLFDGKTSEGWRSATASVFPAKGWNIGNGTLTVLSSEGKESANGGDIITDDEYGAFDLSFFFRLTPGANSGVKYFVTLNEKTQGSAIGLEYQVLDDSLHPDAKMGRNGDRTLASLYDLIKAEKQKRFLRPVGAWNWGRIVVHPDNRVEHFLNGVKVLEYVRGSVDFRKLVAISKYKVWPNFGEAKEGHILLQDHGNEVSYRSIKIKKL
jgi:hypothetical protein